MFGWLKRKPEPKGERLEELPSDGSCPDCGERPLLSGPVGGAARNIMCAHCLSEFTVLDGFGQIIDRNGKASPERARTVYGIEA
jgi:hypothetical protein